MPNIRIREFEPYKVKEPIIVEGFPGVGMVGTISASFLADRLGMKLVGFLSSDAFPPVATIHDYKPVSPARIYASEKHNLLVIYSEFVIPAEVVHALAEEVITWAKGKKAKAIYSLAGIASPEPKPGIYGIASTQKMADLLRKEKVELIKEGATQGVSGVLIAEAAAEKFESANLMVQTNQPLDPRAAGRLLDYFKTRIGVTLDTTPLVAEAQKVESKIAEAVSKLQTVSKSYQDLEQRRAYS